MDIYMYLKKDHKHVTNLMDEVLLARNSDHREALFEEIKLELQLHADAEEATFYKAIESATRSKAVEEQMEHADEEHDEIRDYLEKLSALSIDSEEWIEQFGEFKHAVSHHVKEEENEIFEKARKYLSDKQAKDLTAQMDTLKKQALRDQQHAA